MSGKLLFLATIFVLLLSACSGYAIEEDVAAAISAGIIVPTGLREIEQQHILVEVRRENMTRELNFALTAEFPIRQNITIVSDGIGPVITLDTIQYSPRTHIFTGDWLASLYVESSVLDEVARDRIVLQLEEFENQNAADIAARIIQIENAREALASANETEWEILTLQLQRMELQLERFLQDSNRTRQGLQERLENAMVPILPEHTYAPFDGIIVTNNVMSIHADPRRWTWNFAIADDSLIYFRLSAPPDVVRHGNVFTVRAVHDSLDGYLFTEMKVVTDHFVNSGFEPSINFMLRPLDEVAFVELLAEHYLTPFDVVNSMIFRITTYDVLAYNALVLPVRAIRTEDRREYVLIYEDGNVLRRFISRGLQHSNYVQILMGLEEGQKVVLP